MCTAGRNQATTIFSTLTYIWAFIGNTLIHTEHSHTKNKVQIALVNTENLVHIDTVTTTNANIVIAKKCTAEDRWAELLPTASMWLNMLQETTGCNGVLS